MSELHVDEEQRAEELPSRQGIAALAHDVAIYGGARVALKSLAFLLVPLYARFLSPAQFGVLELVLATAAFVDVFINLPGALARFYFDRDDPAWRRRVITSYLVIETSYPALLIAGLVVFSGALSETVVGTETYATLFVIALADLYVTNVVDLPMNLCRLRRKPVTFAFYSLVRGLTQVVFTVLLVAVWHLGVKGILIASLVSACVALVLTAREYVRDLTRQISWPLAAEMVSFAWPTVISALAFFALNLVDRFFIKHYHGLEDNGLYGTAFRYSQVVLVGVLAFRMGWPQWHYSWLRTGRHAEMVARGANYYFAAMGLLAVLVSAWILPVFHLLMPRRYWDATPAVAPLALAGVATGAYTIFAVGFNVTKRMRLLAPITAAGGALAIGLYFLLIPPFSFLGAAWGTAAALAALSLLVMAVAQRIYPVPWDWRRIGLAFALALGLAFASLATDAWLPFAASLPVRVAIVLAYPLLLVATGFFSADDLAKMRARLRRAP